MPFANNGGVRIHYDVEGDGPPLVLQHGVTMSAEDWREAGYVPALRDSFRLILIDARGHGESDKPHEAGAYASALMADDVVAVLDDLAVERSRYFGFSMGGQIGFTLGVRSDRRVSSLVLGAISPFREEPEKTHISATLERIKARLEGREQLPSPNTGWRHALPGFGDRSAANDQQAMLAAVETLLAEDVSQTAMNVRVPCLLWAGDQDLFQGGARRIASQMPKAEFFAVPNAGHMDAFVATHLVLPRVTAFLTGQSA